MPRTGDPLLRTTKLLLVFAAALFGAIAIGAVVALPSVWFFGDHVRAWLIAHSDKGAIGGDALPAFNAVLVGIVLAASLTILFLRKLIAIIDSVGQGSPFCPENAARLRAMGWIGLATQGLGVLAIPGTVWLRHALDNHRIFAPLSFEGLVIALLLFILARVFEHGTRLAEDVEGTV
jgi:hypothetical protein